MVLKNGVKAIPLFRPPVADSSENEFNYSSSSSFDFYSSSEDDNGTRRSSRNCRVNPFWNVYSSKTGLIPESRIFRQVSSPEVSENSEEERNDSDSTVILQLDSDVSSDSAIPGPSSAKELTGQSTINPERSLIPTSNTTSCDKLIVEESDTQELVKTSSGNKQTKNLSRQVRFSIQRYCFHLFIWS